MPLPFISPYLSPRMIRLWLLVLVVSIGLNGALWWLVHEFFPLESNTAILHYSIDVGVDFIGEGKQIRSLPLLGSIIILFNTILGIALLRADRRAAWILWSTLPPVQLVLLLAFYVLREVNL